MPADFSEIKKFMSRIEKLERELSLKQLQINNLQSLTQSINENAPAETLFRSYEQFVEFIMEIKQSALFFRVEGKWKICASVGMEPHFLQQDYGAELSQFRRQTSLSESDHSFFKLFDLVIPVQHKDEALAYAFVGGFSDEDDIYNKVRFISTMTNIIAVAIENKRMFKEQVQRAAEQQIFDKEVEVAAKIQQSLVPSRLPSGSQYQMSSIYKPHSAVGGDYYDVVEFKNDKLNFCIADITGKGIAAALLMASFQASLHALVHRFQTLEEIVEEMNRAVFRVTQGDKFITLFLAKYEPSTRTLHYINAGHPPPFLVMNGEAVRLTNGTTVLGFLPELPMLEIGGICLTDEATIFSYTDGLTEVCNRAGEEFGDEKLERFLIENAQLPAKELNTRLLDFVENYRERRDFPDDITVLSCKVFK